MEFSWTTFLFEIINFLVLIWILKHFLFKPVMDVIDRRHASIEEQLAESQRLKDESVALKEEYQGCLTDWDHECLLARAELMKELNAERILKTNQLKEILVQEAEKAKVAVSRQRIQATRAIEYQALQQSAQFATTLLRKAAGPELEARLLDILLDDLSNLSSKRIAVLRLQWGESPESIMVTSAYPISEDKRQRLESVLTTVTELTLPVHYDQTPELIAGVCITIGAWIMHANVRDDLRGFTGFAHVDQ
ncbi:F0F1 ATP synthase subunit delta [Halodesulfovibrio marinisediminis]|uniref:ATP synthase subunit b n=1 Tax=Halodesulfovibrio marinisediminis DSM 17456 TaxID=1121457 RepID=A0A1N6GW12_9BACT|nr:F0F1 ATP synthase subunit delta [Halodesulfovibrio marinisediminis]SIO11706.1 F-type H+-transporting ATPase subunit b [Halodesulfovibrio marinisediminis DSM 17456]